MSETIRLSPMTSYYLRKFVEDRQDTLHQLLPDLHGEITLDRLFSRMCRESELNDSQINIIESLVGIHKQTAKSTASDSIELKNLETRLLASLGATEQLAPSSSVSPSILVVKDCLEKLEPLRNQAFFFLGETIGSKYLLETQPQDPWCQKFKLTPNGGIIFQGQLSESLDAQQITYFQTWMDNFSMRCGNILSSFQESNSDNEALFYEM
jgi:hypothetical protein